jgi:hypothetical protein
MSENDGSELANAVLEGSPADLNISPYEVLSVLRTSAATIHHEGKDLTLWLHWQMKRTRYVAKALYEYEAWVTTAQDPGSPKYRVDQICLGIVREADDAYYTHMRSNTDHCAKSDEVWATGGACGRTCGGAFAVFHGSKWSTPGKCMD